MSDSNDQNRYRILFESISEGVLLVNGRNIEDANPVFLEWCGETRNRCIGHPVDLWVVDIGKTKTVVPLDGPEAREIHIRHQNGDFFPARMISVRVPGEGDDKRWVLFHDVSAEKHMEQEMIKHRQLEAIAALSGGIAHDYNNLLTAIIGNLSVALTDLTSNHPLHGLLDQAQQAAMIAKDLTRRLITFSKGGDPVKETVLVAPLVEGATRFALSGSNCVVGFDFEDDLWQIDVDSTQIGQAVHNVVINAKEAMCKGGLVGVQASNLSMEAPRYGLSAGRYISISIRDEGKGISEDVLKRIFDPYFSTKEMGDQRGMGLGLSIANSIVEKHGGRIHVVSEPGAGTTVEILLPASDHELPQKNLSEETEKVADLSGQGRVLVMDDESMILNLADRMLRKLGYDPAFAGTGEAAVKLYKAALQEGNPFALVILDLTVKGGMGGKETILELKKIDPGVRAIVSSGYSEDPVVVDFRRYGFSGVVAKPYRIQEVGLQIKRILSVAKT